MKILSSGTYILDVLVDLKHAVSAAFLSGGELEALRHLLGFLGDTDLVSLKLDFANLCHNENRA